MGSGIESAGVGERKTVLGSGVKGSGGGSLGYLGFVPFLLLHYLVCLFPLAAVQVDAMTIAVLAEPPPANGTTVVKPWGGVSGSHPFRSLFTVPGAFSIHRARVSHYLSANQDLMNPSSPSVYCYSPDGPTTWNHTQVRVRMNHGPTTVGMIGPRFDTQRKDSFRSGNYF